MGKRAWRGRAPGRDKGENLVVGRQLLGRGHGLGRTVGAVLHNGLDLPAVDSALFIELIEKGRDPVGHPDSSDGGRTREIADHSHFDGVLGDAFVSAVKPKAQDKTMARNASIALGNESDFSMVHLPLF